MNKSEIKEIKLFQYVFLENFDFNKYPEHVCLEKYYGDNCSYAWKPIFIGNTRRGYRGQQKVFVGLL